MKPDWKLEVLPLGLRLQAAGAALVQAHRQAVGWVAPALEVIQKLRELPTAEATRFARVEATDLRPVDASPLHARRDRLENDLPLPAQVRERLRPYVGESASEMRVHDDSAAHQLARHYRAEAVAFGSDVFFAEDRYQPHHPEGLALLAHEAVHVGQSLQSNVGWHRSAQGRAAEEEAAHAAEQAVMRGEPPSSAATPSLHSEVASTPHATLSSTGSPAAQQPMRAAEGRPAPTPASSSPAVDIDALRRSLLRDVLQQIRIDAERGG